ncbi:MAG: TonB-dependent receptor [Acidobacteria bacterium]|jgi:outer membrane receptor protein involved in Fe transport|nr:TonB-dependent receptor [Acidobacteriota bacterium]
MALRKKKRRSLYLACLLTTLAMPLAALEVRGTVRDIHDRPLAGIVVKVADGEHAVVTDADGAFAFSVDEAIPFLTLHFVSTQFHLEKRVISLRGAAVRMKVYLIPVRQLKEDVAVTAMNSAEKAIAVPAAQKVISGMTLREELPESVTQAVQNSPGVHFIGKGGIAVTPSIRGLARRRVLFLVDGARITSDRSAGTSGHFFPPELVRQVEVSRSASSVLYGSDAIGGVIQVFSRAGGDPEPGFCTLNLSGHSADEKLNGGISLRGKAGGLSWLVAAQVAQAGNYASGKGTVLNSGYRYYSGSLDIGYDTEKRGFRLRFLGSAGRDVGKPDRANDLAVSSFYPEENTRLLNFSYREDGWPAAGSLNIALFVNASDYELNKVRPAVRQKEVSRNDALDFGFRAFLKKRFSERLSLQSGIDYYGRGGVEMVNETWQQGVLSEAAVPLADGRRGDLGLYSTLSWQSPHGLDWLAGVRLGSFCRSARSSGVFLESRSLAPAFFLGATRRIRNSLTLFVNAGTAFRQPSLSESFYTGITGRSTIVGNPGLEPEKSLNLDAGVKVHGRDLFIAAALFQCSIRGMIEKFPLGGTAYTYANIESGRVRGLELEFQYYPLQKLEIFGNGFYYRGSSGGGGALNDVPSARLFLGTKLWLGRLWAEVDWLAATAQRRPGPAESAVPAFQVCDLKAGCYFSSRVLLFAKIANVFNRAYYANGDPDIPLARGIDLSMGLSLSL